MQLSRPTHRVLSVCAPFLCLALASAQPSAVSAGGALGSAARSNSVVLPQELKERDHEKIGKLIAGYFDARREESGISDAQEDLAKELEKLGKKHAKDGEQPLQGALTLSADLGRALYFATDYSKTARKLDTGSIESRTIEVSFPSDSEISYALWTPSKYKVKDGPYPVLIVLPGLLGGEPMKASEHIIQNWVNNDLRDGCVIAAINMPPVISDWKELATEDDQPGGAARAMYVFAELRDNVAIDFDRVFLAGHGQPAVEAALEIAARYPHMFAGVIGRAGDAGEGMDVTNFRNLPTFFAGAGAGATAFEQRAREAGFENVLIKPGASEADIWAWAQDTPRVANPVHVTLNARTGQRAYWLKVPRTNLDQDVVVEGEIDRESNTITVRGDQIAQVDLFFNDQLLDLSKPVKVVVNGVESEHQFARSLTTALDLAFNGTSDPGRFYVSSRSFDLPE